ncbi:hypothetical protein ACQU0X_25620 [Pseudovibrio ascidiaceicola]|uniref:hypothetical protein n=1 Tax=Pseudovibrio ascidiaceicola TaxID=285279 RepID=UPI003D36B4A5
MEYIEAKGTTLEEMREKAQKSMPANQDEMKLIWMKETDLCSSVTSDKASEFGESIGLLLLELSVYLVLALVFVWACSTVISILIEW